MSRMILVELDTGEQGFFDESREAFKFAQAKEVERTHSVEYVAIAENFDSLDVDITLIYGQELRLILRSVDNVNEWIKSGKTEEHDL